MSRKHNRNNLEAIPIISNSKINETEIETRAVKQDLIKTLILSVVAIGAILAVYFLLNAQLKI